MIGLISNPPYNIKWTHPMFALADERFCEYGVPPESNANFAFVLEGLSLIDDKAAFILPNGILTSSQKDEAIIRKMLIENNLIESVIMNPDGMFESTNIPTCILVINKHKKTSMIEFVDCRNKFEVEVRNQNGQIGGSSHEGRTYHKEVNIYSDQIIDDVCSAISGRLNITGFCYSASIELVKQNGYLLQPSRYIKLENKEQNHRSYEDITRDINSIVRDKNNLKLTMNESIANTLGFDKIYQLEKNSNEITKNQNEMFSQIGLNINLILNDYLATSKNKNEIKFENNDKDVISEIILLVLKQYKEHLMYLNNRENRYLAELRDALIPDLMSGKIDVSKMDNDEHD